LGRGPGEYSQIGDVDVDYSTGNIVIRNLRTISEYCTKGDFVKSLRLPSSEEMKNMMFFDFRKLSNYYVVESYIYSNTVYSGIIVDTTSNLVMRLDYPDEEIDYVSSLPPKRIPVNVSTELFKYKDKVRIINGNNKYILSVNNDLTIDTAYVINYGKYSPNSKPGKILPVDSPYLWRRFDAFESDNYLFMTFHLGTLAKKPTVLLNAFGNEYVYHHSPSMFNKATGELILLSQPEDYKLGFEEDFHDGPPVWPLYISTDNYMISVINTLDLKRYVDSNNVSRELESIASSLKEDSNPVIVRAKLK
jgi:hypothetical protein